MPQACPGLRAEIHGCVWKDGAPKCSMGAPRDYINLKCNYLTMGFNTTLR